MQRVFTLIVVIMVCCTGLMAQRKRPGATTTARESSLGPMRQQTIRGYTYLSATTQTSLATIQQVVGPMTEKLLKAMKENSISPHGPMIFTYHGVTGDPRTKFKLEIGMPVEEGTKAPEGLTVAKIEPFKCATALYTGAIDGIGPAYQKLIPEIFEAGLMPAMISREFYLYWEDVQSPNNVIQIQIGLQ
jgi:effector-binding domain-containing protein